MKTDTRRAPQAETESTPTTMDEIWVQGGRRLKGSVRASGSKNATLPLLAATLLAPGLYRFSNLKAGSYTVDPVLPAGYVLTTGNDPRAVTLPLGQVYLGADFGYRVPLP